MKPLRPQAEARSVHQVDYQGLWERGVRALLFDLDNTLGLWRLGPPDRKTGELLNRLKAQGFKIAVLSNGRLSRRPEVLAYFAHLKIPVIWPARKPLPFGFRRALAELGVPPSRAAMIGDQLLTDILGGNLAGLVTILVSPLSPREHPLTRANRVLERLVRKLFSGKRGA